MIMWRQRIQSLHPILLVVLIGDGEDFRELQGTHHLRHKVTGALTIHHWHCMPLGLLHRHHTQSPGNALATIRPMDTAHLALQHLLAVRVPSKQINPLVGVLGDLHNPKELFVGPIELVLLRIRLLIATHKNGDLGAHNLSCLWISGFEGEARVHSFAAKVLQRFALAQVKRCVQGLVLGRGNIFNENIEECPKF